MFKRGIHVARINEGLYSPQQIPLLQRLIRSLVEVGDYDKADERQFYLYRVQARVYGENSEQMSLAMLERAEWEQRAYYLALGDTSFVRLLTMWELYSAALRNIARKEGNLSENLLRPLHGLLQTQYLISSYSLGSTGALDGNDDALYMEENRFSMVRVNNYKQGQSVITAMREVYGYNEGEQSPLTTEALVQLGDWHMWHQKRESAIAAYQRAWDEFGDLEEGERLREVYFGQPVMLPDMPGANSDLATPTQIRGHVEVSYLVNERGRIKKFDTVAIEPVNEADKTEPVRLLRALKARFSDRGLKTANLWSQKLSNNDMRTEFTVKEITRHRPLQGVRRGGTGLAAEWLSELKHPAITPDTYTTKLLATDGVEPTAIESEPAITAFPEPTQPEPAIARTILAQPGTGPALAQLGSTLPGAALQPG